MEQPGSRVAARVPFGDDEIGPDAARAANNGLVSRIVPIRRNSDLNSAAAYARSNALEVAQPSRAYRALGLYESLR
jgi:hypothetical protein